MRMPRVRFTVRRMMLAVAIIAITLGVGIEACRLKRFREECLLKANYHAGLEVMNSESARFSESRIASYLERVSALTKGCNLLNEAFAEGCPQPNWTTN